VNTVGFCTDEMLDRFSKIQYISSYIENSNKEMGEANNLKQVDDSSLVNGVKWQTLEYFVPMSKLICSTIRWSIKRWHFWLDSLHQQNVVYPFIFMSLVKKGLANYENIEAIIFYHILAVVPEFDLRVFQNPTGTYFGKMTQKQERLIQVRHLRLSIVYYCSTQVSKYFS